LSKLGFASRTEAEKLIVDGRVTVDGQTIRNPKKRVDLGRAKITVSGEVVHAARWRFVVFHKPRGVLTTRRDELGRRTIYDVLPEDLRDLVAVGRLDLATSGLLCLTSDTKLADWLCDPRSEVERTYVVTVNGRVSDEAGAQLLEGVEDEGEHLQAYALIIRKRSLKESHVIMTLREGKNREVRRLCEAVGCKVTKLKRISYGPLALGALSLGAIMELSNEDLRAAFPAAPISG